MRSMILIRFFIFGIVILEEIVDVLLSFIFLFLEIRLRISQAVLVFIFSPATYGRRRKKTFTGLVYIHGE